MSLSNSHTPLKLLPDAELLALVKSDNMEAFEELYYRHWKNLYSFAYKRVRSKEISEEIVQDFLTNLWAGRKTLIIKTSFEGYIYTAVRNLVFNYIARETRRKAYSHFVQLFKIDTDNSTEETIDTRDLQQNIEKGLHDLPEKCRSVFELSRHENKSNKEIALELGISEKTVEGHLTKAIKRLRVTLNSAFLIW
ncbi:RNA polymerase sigma-70 factor [Mucilaginibacter sp. AW1-3]